MEKLRVKRLKKDRWEAFVAYTRHPAAEYFGRELDWFADEEERVLGTVLLDTTDLDFVAMILGRDESGKFRAIDFETDIRERESAINRVVNSIRWHAVNDDRIFPQGGTIAKPIDILTPIVPFEKLHPYFVLLKDSPGFSSAREIIREIMPHFADIDGNFAREFQTEGFDARLWELYLYAYLNEASFLIRREKPAPDFQVEKHGNSVLIEAVIVGRKGNRPRLFRTEWKRIMTPSEVLELRKDYMPIRYGSALFSKLQKRYWELPHAEDLPLVFAIADFHDDQSMVWTSTALFEYLYGVRHDFHYTPDGELVISPLKIEKHRRGEKEIPSGYFFQPHAEHVSAVLFSASGTISKFNRMGKLAGFGSPDVRLIRTGTHHDHDPNACFPRVFNVEVDTENYAESWAEGLNMYHNPNALHPVPEKLFPTIAHHYFRDGQIVSFLPDFHPCASMTTHVIPRRDG